LLLLPLLLLLLQACSDDELSPEAQIRAFVERAVEAGEARSVDGLSELLGKDYIDQHGNNRQRAAGLLRAYFFQHKNIHLFTRIDEIEILNDNQASVSLHVAMAGTVISDVEALAGLRARIYRFELQLVKQDEWRLRHASWAPASIGAFQ
jgi:hypothetical protein